MPFALLSASQRFHRGYQQPGEVGFVLIAVVNDYLATLRRHADEIRVPDNEPAAIVHLDRKGDEG